jgi:membrane-bound lytic murein transglycosylase D
MKSKLSHIALCAGAASSIFFCGCAASHATLTKKPALAVIVTVGNSTAESNSTQPTSFIDDSDIDSLVSGAQFACKHNDFEASHMLLREALGDIKIMQSSDSGWNESEDYYENYYKDIARIYTELMPTVYSDSLPEEISVAAFQKRLTQSLDSIKVPASDSALMQKILGQKNATFNFPIVWNDRVYKALYFLGHGRKGPLDKWISRAYYYLPGIKKMFADSGMPTDLAYLPLIESGFNPLAYSRAHAAGMWQFIASTGSRYGMRKDGWIDERRDFLKSTRGAVSYLKKLFHQFNDWQIALAAYNCGENGMSCAVNRASAKNFWQLRIPRETKNYVPEFIAALIIAKNPGCYGFSDNVTNTFDLDTVDVNDCISLYTVADSLNISPEELRNINPHILHWCTHPNKNVTLYLPKGAKDRFLASYKQSPEDFAVSWSTYQVRLGETLKGIARRFNVPAEALISLNNFSQHERIAAGQEISLPISLNSSTSHGPMIRAGSFSPRRHYSEMDVSGMRVIKYKVRAGDCVWGLSQLFRVDRNDLCKWNHISGNKSLRAGETVTIYKPSVTSVSAPPPAPSPVRRIKPAAPAISQGSDTVSAKHIVYYKVRKGDNLWNIAQSFKVAVKELSLINNLQPDSTLLPGDVLRVPMSEEL